MLPSDRLMKLNVFKLHEGEETGKLSVCLVTNLCEIPWVQARHSQGLDITLLSETEPTWNKETQVTLKKEQKEEGGREGSKWTQNRLDKEKKKAPNPYKRQI